MRGESGGDATRPEREAFAWARLHTPSDAIFVEDGARRDAAVLAARSVLWGGQAWAKKWGYAPAALEIRERAAGELLSGGTLSRDVAIFIEDLGRPIIVLEGSPRGSASPNRLTTQEGNRRPERPIYEREGVRLVMVQGGR
jgi:hypothetical protein